jgi:rhamnogalacturonan endolyase
VKTNASKWVWFVLLSLAANGSAATLSHRWSFNGDLADSVGGSDAQIVSLGTNPAYLTDSQVVLTGGPREQSDYVVLGNYLLYGRSSVTLEFWATQHSVQNWGRIFDFGSSISEYLMMSWSRGTNTNQDRVEWKDAELVTSDDTNAPYEIGVEYHIAMVIEAGAGLDGKTRVTWYAAPASQPWLGAARGRFDTSNTLALLFDSQNWLGRSFWALDSTANAAYNEVRIWDGAMSLQHLETLHQLGPDDIQLPEEPDEQPSTLGVRQMEWLDRGVVAVRRSSSEVFISWRLLGSEWKKDIGFHIYRNGTRITPAPITGATNYIDATSFNGTYSVSAVIDGLEDLPSDPVSVLPSYFLEVPLLRPEGGTTPDGVNYTYSPNDCSVGDLTGDGKYEIIVKWDPSNSKDNAHSGYTGNVYLDAYTLEGQFLWRIDLGINIRAGAHYTQFMVYDLDGDGRAEVACKTAPGTIDGQGNFVLLDGDDPSADYRNSSGYILSGPEYLTVFDGLTGAELATTPYVPPRGTVSSWGDNYGNRVDRFLACVAYLDGQRPSLVMCRGYYTRAVLAAWDWRDGQLTQRWVFDTDNGYPSYRGQGNHNLSVADVDGDGKDEIIYGSCTIDHDGTGLYSTGLGHGDAMHVSDMDPTRPGLEVWQCHESSAAGATFRDAATGQIIWDHYNEGDVGRAAAAHIDARYVGYQMWSHAAPGTYNTANEQISTARTAMNFLVWWTGDLQRELLDAVGTSGTNPILDKWYGDGSGRLISLYSVPTAYSTASNNGTKANPCLSGDILGDWREEIILRSSDNTKLRIFIPHELTTYRLYSLMHDSQYRLAIAWQNVAYNQPPHPSFYLGEGMAPPPTPKIRYAGVSKDGILWQWWKNIPGWSLRTLVEHANYPDTPDGQTTLDRLETPRNWDDHYGSRLRGYLIPPETGDYIFWISADDTAWLFLSPDARAENAQFIAAVPENTGYLQWDKFEQQQSASIPLAAGRKYYIEVLHKENAGGDHLAVAWQGPTLAQQIIEGQYLRPWRGEVFADLNADGWVDGDDLVKFIDMWLLTDCQLPLNIDLNGDCMVNHQDFSVLAGQWLGMTGN